MLILDNFSKWLKIIDNIPSERNLARAALPHPLLCEFGFRRPPVGARATRDQHCELKRLLRVQPGIDLRFIGTRQIGLGETACAADTLGDILAGELDVHAAQHGTAFFVNSEGSLHFTENVVEAPRLHAARGSFGVSVHGIAHPQYL